MCAYFPDEDVIGKSYIVRMIMCPMITPCFLLYAWNVRFSFNASLAFRFFYRYAYLRWLKWSEKTVEDIYLCLISIPLNWYRNPRSGDYSWYTKTHFTGAVTVWMVFACISLVHCQRLVMDLFIHPSYWGGFVLSSLLYIIPNRDNI